MVQRAKGVLIFPSVIGGSFVVGSSMAAACCAWAVTTVASTARQRPLSDGKLVVSPRL
jgi:hypothetical protein